MNRHNPVGLIAKLACAALVAAAGTAHAANYYWLGNSSTSTAFDSNAQPVTSTNYDNWASTSYNAFSVSTTTWAPGTTAVPGSLDTAIFGTTPTNKITPGSSTVPFTYADATISNPGVAQNEANRAAAFALAGSSGAFVNLSGGSKSAVAWNFTGGASATNFLFDNGTKGYIGNYVRFYNATNSSNNPVYAPIISLASGAGNVTFASDWVGIRGQNQSFQNDSASALTFGQVVSYANTAPTAVSTSTGLNQVYNIQITGSGTGAVNFLGGIADGSTSSTNGATDLSGNATYAKLALVVNNTNGTVNINGLGQNDYWSAANSSNGVYNGGTGTKYQGQYSGGTTVNAGRLNANIAGALGSGSVTINGGTLAINASGYAYGTNSYSVNPNGGTPVVTTNTVSGVPITVNSTGTLLLTTNSVVVGNLTITSGGTLGIDSDNTFTASSLALGGTLNFTHLDTAVGHYTLWTGATATGDFASVLGGALTWSDNAGLWTAADANKNYSLSISTGALTVAAVPEPSTLAAFGLGLGVLGLTVIRRRKAQA